MIKKRESIPTQWSVIPEASIDTDMFRLNETTLIRHIYQSDWPHETYDISTDNGVTWNSWNTVVEGYNLSLSILIMDFIIEYAPGCLLGYFWWDMDSFWAYSLNNGGTWTRTTLKDNVANKTLHGSKESTVFKIAPFTYLISRDGGYSGDDSLFKLEIDPSDLTSMTATFLGTDTLKSTYKLLITPSGRYIKMSNSQIAVSDDGGITWEWEAYDTSDFLTGLTDIFIWNNKIVIVSKHNCLISSDNGDTFTKLVDFEQYLGNNGSIAASSDSCYLINRLLYNDTLIVPRYNSSEHTINIYTLNLATGQFDWLTSFVLPPDPNSNNYPTYTTIRDSYIAQYYIPRIITGYNKPTNGFENNDNYNYIVGSTHNNGGTVTLTVYKLLHNSATIKSYISKPLTGAQAKQLVAECKAYVQGLKNSL